MVTGFLPSLLIHMVGLGAQSINKQKTCCHGDGYQITSTGKEHLLPTISGKNVILTTSQQLPPVQKWVVAQDQCQYSNAHL